MITQILLQQTIIMFLLMMLGLLLSRRGMITEQGSRDLSNVLLYAVIPCVILRSYMSEFSMDKLRAMGVSAVIAVIAFAASIGVAYLTCGTRHRIENFAVAFCNAGFDLLGQSGSPYPSLTGYAADPVINLTIMLLIVLGGIGFLTWDDVWENRLHIRRYRMQSKVILVTTLCLILLPALFFFLADYSALPIGKRLLASFFQAVSPRTAGFNTMDLTAMTEASRAMMILLMLVGGSPGSTAGGMKTTTLAVLLANAVATFRRRESPQFFGRRVGSGAVKTAATILSMYLMLFFGCGLFISIYEALPLSTCLYETASAVGTVGLTLGITPQLHLPSQLLLILLMYLGRVGGLTLVYAAMSSREPSVAKLPLEKITVG